MRHRAIKDLNQLNDEKLIREISIGLEKIYENCTDMWGSAETLAKEDKYQSFKLLEAFSCEEAAKYLILLDALRCPKKENSFFTRQLVKFNDHLAKGIYSKLCNWRPDKYISLCNYIKTELDDFYLDGPEGIEWIFRNSIISRREECIYVDYVDYDGNHEWFTPKSQFLNIGAKWYHEPSVLKMVKALHAIGLYTPQALKSFSKFWREFEFEDETHYQEFRKANITCLETLESQSLLKKAKDDHYALFINEYHFPLYKVDMKENKVSKQALKEIQDSWHPDY